MSLVGIIANPESGKDIRRIVSQAITIGNQQKVNLVRRILLGLTAGGAERIALMPDQYGIAAHALDTLHNRRDVLARTSLIEMPVRGNAEDTVQAARQLQATGAGCIVTLGGDGTVRLAARSCGKVPLLPISTGTNNVVPTFVEGTVAGLAAACVARNAPAGDKRFCYQHKYLEVHVNGHLSDIALVDVALVTTYFTGARAVWETELVRQVFATRAHPANIGLSALIGMLHPVGLSDPHGVMLCTGKNGREVLAPIAPGLITRVGIEHLEMLRPDIPYPISGERPAVLALDGEREIPLGAGDHAEVILRLDGPWLVDVSRTLLWAVENRFFVTEASHRRPATGTIA